MHSGAVYGWLASLVPVYIWPQIIITDSLCSISLITRKSLLIKWGVRFYTLLTLLHYSVSVAQLQLMCCLSYVTSLTFFPFLLPEFINFISNADRRLHGWPKMTVKSTGQSRDTTWELEDHLRQQMSKIQSTSWVLEMFREDLSNLSHWATGWCY